MDRTNRIITFSLLSTVLLFIVVMIIVHIAITGEALWTLRIMNIVCSVTLGRCLVKLVEAILQKENTNHES